MMYLLIRYKGFFMSYPYYQAPNYFANAIQHQNQQLQQTNLIGRIIPVSAKEEAIVMPVDVITGQPTFFYNKAKNEFYLKQCDVKTGTPIFKVYGEIQPEIINDTSPINPYEKEFKHIYEGIDSLHRLIEDLKEAKYDESVTNDEFTPKSTKSDGAIKSTKSK